MKAEVWAVLTAVCWGVGSLLEKRGVKIGELAPIMGTFIRTAFSLPDALRCVSFYLHSIQCNNITFATVPEEISSIQVFFKSSKALEPSWLCITDTCISATYDKG